MRKELHRRLAVLAQRHEEAETRFVRLVQVLRPDMPEAAQGRWLELAEQTVLAELQAKGQRTVMLWSHAASPGVVTVDGPGVRYRVGVDERDAVTILERSL